MSRRKKQQPAVDLRQAGAKAMSDISTTRYGAIVDGKRGAYGVVIPDLPGCTAMGRTIDEALASATGAAAAWASSGGAPRKPRSLEALANDPQVRAELELGGVLAIVPLIRDGVPLRGGRRRLSITLSAKAAEAFEWLKRKTDADTESEVIRNALRLHYVLLQAAEEGDKFFVRGKNGDTPIDLFVEEPND